MGTANWIGGRTLDDTPTAGPVAAGREDGAPLRGGRRVDGRSGHWAGPEMWLMRIEAHGLVDIDLYGVRSISISLFWLIEEYLPTTNHTLGRRTDQIQMSNSASDDPSCLPAK